MGSELLVAQMSLSYTLSLSGQVSNRVDVHPKYEQSYSYMEADLLVSKHMINNLKHMNGFLLKYTEIAWIME